MQNLVDLNTYPVKDVLHLLLKDKTTKKNIIFATDNYLEYGEQYGEKCEITVDKIRGFDALEIQPRVLKSLEAQKLRTRVKAEVMTPSWIICKMNAYCDEEWFDRPNVFEVQGEQCWTPTEGKIECPGKKTWKSYVDSRRIEITCGEAPYIVTRYDVTTGEMLPIKQRTGMLDRKLRIVNENADSDEEWLKWTLRAFQSVYGYEWQGDNLLIARINLLNTYVDYMQNRLQRAPTLKELRKIANIIAWNFWQMDGRTGTIPFGVAEKSKAENEDFCFDGLDSDWQSVFSIQNEEKEPENVTPLCKIWDWRYENAFLYKFEREN